MSELGDALYRAAVAADEARGGPLRRLRATARTDRYSTGAMVLVARYQHRKRHGRRLLAEKRERVERLRDDLGQVKL